MLSGLNQPNIRAPHAGNTVESLDEARAPNRNYQALDGSDPLKKEV